LKRKTTAATASSGTTTKAIRASFAFTSRSTTARPAIFATSVTSATMPAENISATFSTSLVARVTRRPTGWRSKKPRCRRWRWSKTSRRRSFMADWPVRDITYMLTNCRPEPSSTAPR
jgi:hypothetical protein